MLDADPAHPSPKKGAEPPIFGPCLLCPNGWMDQDTTSYEPKRYCVRRGPPIFRPYLLWPNGWMDQDATWYVVYGCVHTARCIPCERNLHYTRRQRRFLCTVVTKKLPESVIKPLLDLADWLPYRIAQPVPAGRVEMVCVGPASS